MRYNEKSALCNLIRGDFIIALVAAIAENHVIGREGKLPWYLPADLAHFRRLTRGQVVVMGRKTYEAIGRPLSGRTNIILTRNPRYRASGCVMAHSIESLLANPGRLYIIGGADLYRQLLPYANRLHLTRVAAHCEGDAFFPALDPEQWELTAAELRLQDEQNPFSCKFETYRRRSMAEGMFAPSWEAP